MYGKLRHNPHGNERTNDRTKSLIVFLKKIITIFNFIINNNILLKLFYEKNALTIYKIVWILFVVRLFNYRTRM